MAVLDTNNSFQSWILTENETIQGCILTTLNTQVIQNQIASYAQERLNLELDMTNPQRFVQQEADLKGKISALRYLLDLSESAQKRIVEPENNSGPFNSNF